MSKHTGFSAQSVMTAGGVLGIFLLAAAALIVPLRAQQTSAFGHDPTQDAQNCLHNEKQLGLALIEYAYDYDERFPVGTQNTPRQFPTGVGWAGQFYSYYRTSYAFRCPTDPTKTQKPRYSVSYGLNGNMAQAALAQFNNPARTLELFEVQNDLVMLHQTNEGAALGAKTFSPAGNGTDGSLRAGRGGSVSPKVLYATGYLGERVPDTLPGQFASSTGRHAGGANFAFADGHVKFEQPNAVSAGTDAPDMNAPQTGGATGTAAGTQAGYNATFSLN